MPPRSSLSVRCPAKINPFLSVGPRDARGYHPIHTVFQAVSLFDDLSIEIAEQSSFQCNQPLPDRNTVTRAWALLGEFRSLPPLKVRLTKRIPSEAGLGGGSSDAAGFIRGVLALIDWRMDPSELRDLALAVGADVPFFLLGGRARGEGYGEILTAFPDPPEQWLTIVKPEVGCPTAGMYAALDAIGYPWRDLSADVVYNDFDRVAPSECHEAKDRLRQAGASETGLSGSGSAVFGFFASKEHAERSARDLTLRGYAQAFAVKFLTRAESVGVL